MSVYRFILVEEANHSVRRLCEVLGVTRSCFYAWRRGDVRGGGRDTATLVHIRAIFAQHRGRYGSPRVTRELRAAQHLRVNRKRVARLMRADGLVARPRRAFRGGTTDSTHELPVAPNVLNRNFSASQPNKAIVGDITYLPTRAGWVFLAVLIDLYSRKVVGWAMDDNMETSLCTTAFQRMLATRGPMPGAVHHTDRGSQYASHAYRQELAKAGMVPSMSRKGNCWDNAVAESFFGTLEQELVPDEPWRGLSEAKQAVGHYIHAYYNAVRRHSTLGYVSPVEFESIHQASRSEAA